MNASSDILAPSTVDKIRADKNLPKLKHYVIDVVSGSHDPSTSAKSLLLARDQGADQLKELKLGSTGIRKWLAEQKKTNSETSKSVS